MEKQEFKCHRVMAVCIKEYQDEDSLADFEDGLIQENEIKTYKIGDKHWVVADFYHKEYWKELTKLNE